MTDLRQAAQQALEALKSAAIFVDSFRGQKATQEAITALKAALEQPEQEPVAWMVYTQDGQSVYVTDNPTDIQEGQRALPLYTIQPAAQRPWVGLTDEEVLDVFKDRNVIMFAKAIEAKLKERNNE